MIPKAVFWQLMDSDNRIRIPHPLPTKTTPYGVVFCWHKLGFEPI